jgi:hypothetical protein
MPSPLMCIKGHHRRLHTTLRILRIHILLDPLDSPRSGLLHLANHRWEAGNYLARPADWDVLDQAVSTPGPRAPHRT